MFDKFAFKSEEAQIGGRMESIGVSTPMGVSQIQVSSRVSVTVGLVQSTQIL